MAEFIITENASSEANLYYVQSATAEILNSTSSRYDITRAGGRSVLTIDCPDSYSEIVGAETADKLAEVIVINYKYDYFKKNVSVYGLSALENEILLTSLIAADLDDDKRYAFGKIKGEKEIAVDGTYNFRLQPLKKKWADVVGYIPSGFINAQLKEFITYLLENKKKRVYIDGGNVYDSHYRKLMRCELLGGENLNIIREVLLSNCGEVELSGEIPEADEKYLKEFYGDKIYFSSGYFG